MDSKNKKLQLIKQFKKCPTGISGLDNITLGGLPRNRSTLICGGAGSGKTMLSLEFLIRGATVYNEPGLFIAFEESEKELYENIKSLGFDVEDLVKRNQLILDHIKIERTEFTETGEYNLDGLFIRLANTINQFKIKRIALDTLEMLFSNLSNELVLRSELQRLFSWFKNKKVTVVVTAEQGVDTFTRYGLEEYVADCVILLDNRMFEQIATRRIRIAKYRGSSHGNNEYPFIITDKGFSVEAITSLDLDYTVSKKTVSSGIAHLDNMLGVKGFYCGSSILVSGPAGIGKSSFGAAFVNAACQRGEKCFYFAYEESVDQIIRNMNSIGINLDQWIKKDLLKFEAINPNSNGLETQLVNIQNEIDKFNPKIVIMDPISNLKAAGQLYEVHDMLAILIAYFKRKNITVMFTSLVYEDRTTELAKTNVGISSLMDTWILLQYLYGEGERNRGITVLKSRGMEHSNQLREVVLSNKGIHLHQVYLGQGKVLAGSARLNQAAEEETETYNRKIEMQLKEHKLIIARKKLESKIKLLHDKIDETKIETKYLSRQKEHLKNLVTENRTHISKMRMADISPSEIKSRVMEKKNATNKKNSKKAKK